MTAVALGGIVSRRKHLRKRISKAAEGEARMREEKEVETFTHRGEEGRRSNGVAVE